MARDKPCPNECGYAVDQPETMKAHVEQFCPRRGKPRRAEQPKPEAPASAPAGQCGRTKGCPKPERHRGPCPGRPRSAPAAPAELGLEPAPVAEAPPEPEPPPVQLEEPAPPQPEVAAAPAPAPVLTLPPGTEIYTEDALRDLAREEAEAVLGKRQARVLRELGFVLVEGAVRLEHVDVRGAHQVLRVHVGDTDLATLVGARVAPGERVRLVLILQTVTTTNGGKTHGNQ